MATCVVVGAQWGDEGKGKTIDIMSAKAQVIVRSQGGNNAGHTVVVGNEVFKLHLIPSGVLYGDKTCLIAAGVVVDPKVILGEMDGLSSRGYSCKDIKIDARAHIIMPWHIELDRLAEAARGKNDIGTTLRGIGPCYTDKAERIGIRLHELCDPSLFAKRCRAVCAIKNEIITKIYGAEPLDAEKIITEYSQYASRLISHMDDVSVITYNAIKENKAVLFEGAQGMLLDLDMGTYPYVTSSHPVSGGVCVGTGIGPTLINEVIGVAKAYTTRVGKGPFPTELFDDIGDTIRNRGNEFGTTTGRPRRCGWFDAVIMRQSIRVNGLTSIALNKLDTLSDIGKLKICVAYKLDNGEILDDFPYSLETLSRCTPVYETYEGFTGDLSLCKTYDDLPVDAKAYVEKLEKLINCPINMVGVGPGREQNLTK